jgi:hypothetical protein
MSQIPPECHTSKPCSCRPYGQAGPAAKGCGSGFPVRGPPTKSQYLGCPPCSCSEDASEGSPEKASGDRTPAPLRRPLERAVGRGRAAVQAREADIWSPVCHGLSQVQEHQGSDQSRAEGSAAGRPAGSRTTAPFHAPTQAIQRAAPESSLAL